MIWNKVQFRMKQGVPVSDWIDAPNGKSSVLPLFAGIEVHVDLDKATYHVQIYDQGHVFIRGSTHVSCRSESLFDLKFRALRSLDALLRDTQRQSAVLLAELESQIPSQKKEGV